MPQSERSQVMTDLLRWLSAKTKKDRGARGSEIQHHVIAEITSLGATKRTAMGYVDTLQRMGFVTLRGSKYITTQTGENWLEKKVS